MNKPAIEQKILKTVRNAENPPDPREVAVKVGKGPAQEKVAREVIRSLVDRGVLRVTLDWKLRA
jgi:hypothetical protein